MLENGRSGIGTLEAFSKATRSDASLEGVREARSNSPGLNTLEGECVSKGFVLFDVDGTLTCQ